ncbi:permease [Methanocorpusculum labreanum Z]|uniref:Permease n=1 Tax=Methanocorpusculum labreanum (strain ATCC 43576 / DSM 4855 / Z) TaxID=410358 RepID=A2SRN5_METLZ|nr:permease [Methanocorpusculum labreanum]ABN06991.1 permease [Methanocorpusculum labreanum Z]
MSFTETLLAAAQYFLVIALELTALFIVVCLIVGALNVYVPKEKMQKVLGHSGSVRGSVIGAAFGAITPFCSCSTIPVTLGFLKSGVAFSSAMSFLFASPLLNPVILAMMLVVFGPEITVVYAVMMFTAAVLIGLVLERLGFKKYVKPVAVEGMTEATGSKRKRIIMFAWTTFRQMIPYLLLGAAIGAFIYGFLPADWILAVAGPQNLFAIPVAAIIGIPLYIRAETILPISAALLSKGMGVGTVAALLIGGAGMSIPEITMLSAIFKKQFVMVFVATIFLAAVLTGITVQVIV